jgi:hypothetical protein
VPRRACSRNRDRAGAATVCVTSKAAGRLPAATSALETSGTLADARGRIAETRARLDGIGAG